MQGLIVYDSSSSEYDIENNHEISTYHYVSTEFGSKPRFEPKSRVQETPMLISTTHGTPVIIWNTKAEIMFGVDETYNHTYNIFEQNETITGALRTLVDDSENSQYFRKGLRVFGGSYNDNENFEPLIGTNTYLISGGRFNTRKGNDGDDIVSITHLPEYKPFYFFFGPQNYEDAERAFLEHVTINLKYDSVKPRLALSLAFMHIVDALIESKKCNCDKFDEKFLQHLEKIVDDIFDYPKAT